MEAIDRTKILLYRMTEILRGHNSTIHWYYLRVEPYSTSNPMWLSACSASSIRMKPYKIILTGKGLDNWFGRFAMTVLSNEKQKLCRLKVLLLSPANGANHSFRAFIGSILLLIWDTTEWHSNSHDWGSCSSRMLRFSPTPSSQSPNSKPNQSTFRPTPHPSSYTKKADS